MRKYIFGALALAAVAMAATAAPAFTATSNTGTVAVSVTAQAPPAPCLTVSPGTVDFGTLPFSTNWAAGRSESHVPVTVSFCGTATGQNLFASTTPATGPSGTWTPSNVFNSNQPCAPNVFYLELYDGQTAPLLTGTPVPLAGAGLPATVYPPGDKPMQLFIQMPCLGSNGPGETKSLTVTFMAALP